MLSLFFIDKVDKYRLYADDDAVNGIYARIFEEEYRDAVKSFELGLYDESYAGYLGSIEAEKTHAGYFSVDRKNHMTESRISAKKDGTSDDVSAFDLIMKDRERLLSLGEPVTATRSDPRYVLSSPTLHFVKAGTTRMCSRYVHSGTARAIFGSVRK